MDLDDRYTNLMKLWNYGHNDKNYCIDLYDTFCQSIEFYAKIFSIDLSRSQYSDDYSYYCDLLDCIYYFRYCFKGGEYFAKDEVPALFSIFEPMDIYFKYYAGNILPKHFYHRYRFLSANDKLFKDIYSTSPKGNCNLIEKDVFDKLYWQFRCSSFYKHSPNNNCFCLDFSRRCLFPVVSVLYDTDRLELFNHYSYFHRFMYLILPCRSCSSCYKNRGLFWLRRAYIEVKRSTRTWFVTLTMTPANHFANHRSMVFNYIDSFPPHERDLLNVDGRPTEIHLMRKKDIFGENVLFSLLCKGFGNKVSLFLKRLRKNTGKKFRYFFVFEKHKSGDPHVHMLIHQQCDNLLKKAEVQEEWSREGFSHVRLLKEDLFTARYVCKYLMKEGMKGIRVRASFQYGALTPSEG
ncbi:replication initiation protein [Liberibacter phage pCLasGDXH1]|nr:replication initiation protein [Liberibacter phage pCLasGDXH1]